MACPYSHPDREVRLKRFHAANAVASELMRASRENVFSPISHTHPIAEQGDLPLGWDFWEAYDRAFLSVSHKLYVLMLEGWEESVGVAAELEIAREMAIPVYFLKGES